jgi:hypothetical protein
MELRRGHSSVVFIAPREYKIVHCICECDSLYTCAESGGDADEQVLLSNGVDANQDIMPSVRLDDFNGLATCTLLQRGVREIDRERGSEGERESQ